MPSSRPDTDHTSRRDGSCGDRPGWIATVPFLGLTNRCERWVPSTVLSSCSHEELGSGLVIGPTGYEVMRRVPFDFESNPVTTSCTSQADGHEPSLATTNPYEEGTRCVATGR